jgi:DNA polymerase-3 subunit gamma/tau
MNDQGVAEVRETGGSYRVLARAYRPKTFAELIGQQAMVRTLTNAFRSGRLAHAFVLTGVRGVGKTTTARIIARAFNCIGPDGTGGPTVEPCGECEHCRAIDEDRHVDVLEMDAASHTGVDDIRELIDGARYRPATARTKVYVIDEVHMLSKNAFNALLKTLEEPPPHVKFVFATTEVRRVPVTVLSRCQRFDLRRVNTETLADHYAGVAESEGAKVSADALKLIARAADGSVRDGLSLLDQAIAHRADDAAEIGAADVRTMLGLADRTHVFDLLDSVLKGEIAAALDLFADQYTAGADPAAILEEMLELVHWLTRVKIVPAILDAADVPEAERVRGRTMADALAMAALARAWQMLFKGLSEVRAAPSGRDAADMVLVRMAYAADLPTPAEAVRSLNQGTAPGPASPAAPPAPSAQNATPPEPAPVPETDVDDAPKTGDSDARDRTDEATRHPLVRAALETFPGARVESVRQVADPARDPDSDEPA